MEQATQIKNNIRRPLDQQNAINKVKLSLHEVRFPNESNILVTTWDENPFVNFEEDQEDRVLFYMNETLLETEQLNAMFSQKNMKTVLKNNVDFICTKG